MVFPGPQNLASVVGRHPQPFQRVRDLGLDLLQADIVDEDLHQMVHGAVAGEPQIVLGQGVIDVLGQVRVGFEVFPVKSMFL